MGGLGIATAMGIAVKHEGCMCTHTYIHTSKQARLMDTLHIRKCAPTDASAGQAGKSAARFKQKTVLFYF